jgi:hypothetical protein
MIWKKSELSESSLCVERKATMKASEIFDTMGERVEYDGRDYIFAGASYRFDPTKGYVYSSILKSTKARSVMGATLEQTKRKESETMEHKDIKHNLEGTVFVNGKPYILKAAQVVYRLTLFDPASNSIITKDADLVEVEEHVKN